MASERSKSIVRVCPRPETGSIDPPVSPPGYLQPMVERRRAWRAVVAELFRFTTTDLRDLHVALMTAFEDAAVLAPALNLEQVRSALTGAGWDEPVGDDVLQ